MHTEQNERERKDMLAACIEVLLIREPERAEAVIAARLLDTAQVRDETRAHVVARMILAATANESRPYAFWCGAFTGMYTDDPQCDVVLSRGKYRVQLLGGLDQTTHEAYLISPDSKISARLTRAIEAVKEEMARQE